jgi:hypothetical protein
VEIDHPLFERWLAELAEGDQEIFVDVMALLTALEDYGRDLDDEAREESHPVVTARYDLHALRAHRVGLRQMADQLRRDR